MEIEILECLGEYEVNRPQDKYKDFDFIKYGDTDSCFISLQEVLEEFGYADKTDKEKHDFLTVFINEVVNPALKISNQEMADYTNAYENCMDWEYENMFSSLIMVSKKKYIMRVVNKEGHECVDKPYWKIMGMESVKKAAYPRWSTPLLEEAYKICMDKTEDDMQQFVKKSEELYQTLEIEDIAIPTGVNNLEKYETFDGSIYGKGTPKHVKAALVYNNLIAEKGLKHLEPVKSGEKIKYVQLRKGNSIGQEVVAFTNFLPKEFGLDKEIDKAEMFHKGFIQPLEKCLAVLSYTPYKVNKVDNFFELD